MVTKLKQSVLAIALLALFAATLSASPVACPAPPPPGVTVDTFPPPGGTGAVIGCPSLTPITITNIEWVPASGTVGTGQLDVTSKYVDDGDFIIGLNPNMSNPGPGYVDFYLWLTANGPVTAFDITVGGQNATVSGIACSAPIDRVNGNTCSNGIQLASLVNFSGNPRREAFFNTGFNNPTYYFFDFGLGPNGANTSTSLSFRGPDSAVPEPMSMALTGLGSGLLLLYRRRTAAAKA